MGWQLMQKSQGGRVGRIARDVSRFTLRTKDGRLVFARMNNAFMKRVLRAMGKDELNPYPGRVRLRTDVDNYRVAFEFHDDIRDVNSFAVIADHKRAGGESHTGSAFVSMRVGHKPPIRGALAIDQTTYFDPEYEVTDGFWVVQLAPQFGPNMRRADAPPDCVGVYRLIEGEEVVYVGQGNIRQRLRVEHCSKTWDAAQHFPLQAEVERFRWEKYYIDKHVKQYGSLPKYNRNAGRKAKIFA